MPLDTWERRKSAESPAVRGRDSRSIRSGTRPYSPGRTRGGNGTRLRSSVIWRIAEAFILFFAIVSFSFIAVEVLPNPPGIIIPRGPGPGYDRCGTIATWALDQPVGIRYLVYVANIFRGQWGPSLINSCQPVTTIVLAHSVDTLILTFGALALSGALARGIGPAVARRHGRIPGAVGSATALASAALPAAGLGLIVVLALQATGPGLSPVGDHSPGYASMPVLAQLADYLAHLFVPFLTVVALSVGFLVLAMRNASLYEQVRRGPRLILDSLAGGPSAPGERRSAVPLLLPEMTAYVGWTMSAALLVEIAFGLDGLGVQLERSAQWDSYTANGIFLFLSLLLVATLTLIDLISMRSSEAWLASEPPIQPAARKPTRIVRDFAIRPATLAGAALLASLVVMAIAAPLFVSPYNSLGGSLGASQPPSPSHLLGTGAFGVDILSGVLAGGVPALLAAASAFGLGLIAGIVVAVSAGIRGGRADQWVVLFTNAFLCLPWLPLLALLGLAPGVPGYLALAAVSLPIPATILHRDVVELLQDRGFPEPSPEPLRAADDSSAASAWSRGSARLLISLSPIIVSSALLAASLAVLLLAGSAFVLPSWAFFAGPTASWPGWETQLVLNWQEGMGAGAWFSMVPFVLLLFAASLAFALLGFSLRETCLPYPLSRPFSEERAVSGEARSGVHQG